MIGYMQQIKQEFSRMMVDGRSKAEILLSLGVSDTTFAAWQRELIKRKVIQGTPTREQCEYSRSCFACPLKDCAVDPSMAARVNVLPTDFTYQGVPA